MRNHLSLFRKFLAPAKETAEGWDPCYLVELVKGYQDIPNTCNLCVFSVLKNPVTCCIAYDYVIFY